MAALVARGAGGGAGRARRRRCCARAPRAPPSSATATREFRVAGRDVERAVALNDVTTADATAYVDHRLKRLGVNRLLARAGAADGDVVWIGDFSFEYRTDA